MKKYRHFSEEFKREIVAKIDSGECSQSQLCRDHHLSASLVDRWKAHIHNGTLRSIPSARERQLERELEKYKAKVGELTLHVDLLKKIQVHSTSTRRSTGYIVTGHTSNPSSKLAK